MMTHDPFSRIGAVACQVDAVILGGDLFHDNKPSRKAMHT
jgi:DNA repair exonuclease SbcCD nuclease subunit